MLYKDVGISLKKAGLRQIKKAARVEKNLWLRGLARGKEKMFFHEVGMSFTRAQFRRIQKAARFSKNKGIRSFTRTKHPYP